MMKSGIPVLMVDSIIESVKFYTEKMAFDIVELWTNKESQTLDCAVLRKGKCFLNLKVPKVDELVEFSQIKHCLSRGAGVYAEMKKGIEKYYERCKSKGIRIVQDLQDQPWGQKTFVVKDPFGFKLTFAQDIAGVKPSAMKTFAGLEVDKSKPESTLVEEMINYLTGFGLSRRAARKYAKRWVKDLKKK